MAGIPEGVTRVTVGGLTVGGAWGDPAPEAPAVETPDKAPDAGQEVS